MDGVQFSTKNNCVVIVRFWQILLQKSPRRSCRIKMRNNRIGVNGFLNQPCTLIPDLESILRTRMRKIVLQHNLPGADSCTAANDELTNLLYQPPISGTFASVITFFHLAMSAFT